MPQPEYDAIVIGLGAMGSAAAYQLAKRGARVLGIDHFSPPHDKGSTHGGSRVTRLAIGEGAQYSPLVMRSHEIWREIERETGQELLTTNGGLIISSRNNAAVTHVKGFFQNTVAAAERFGIAHELLDAAAIRRRFPQFAVGDEEFGYYEPSAGLVRPEACVAAQLSLAEKHGAELHLGETVRSFEDGRVTTDKGTYGAAQIIVAVGAWLTQLWGRADLFKVHRQVQLWFDIEGDVEPFLPERFPIFIWELPNSRQGIYGFPAIDGARGGLKVATESFETTTTPESVAREVSAGEIVAVYEKLVAPYLPGIGPRCLRAATCLYTVTPDFGFVIDRLPGLERAIVASPCSGHGFKHSAAIGEALAEWVVDGRSRLDLSPFGLSRFAH